MSSFSWISKNPTPSPVADPASVSLNGITAHPPSANPTPTHTQHSTSSLPHSSLLLSQHKFCTSTLKNLKKTNDPRPSLPPVDVVSMNIPHHLEIITHPMESKAIEETFDNSLPGKEALKPHQPRYLSADQFIADVRLVFSNCVKFNGPEHPISLIGRDWRSSPRSRSRPFCRPKWLLSRRSLLHLSLWSLLQPSNAGPDVPLRQLRSSEETTQFLPAAIV